MEKEKIEIEERTLEELLRDLRVEKNWDYLQVIEKLNQLGLNVEEKKIKKWEIGLEYPDLDTIYKLSELYFIPIENFVMAKTNSYTKGLQSVHMIFIKWFCYLTGISLKIGVIGVYTIIVVALIGSLLFFINKVETFLKVRQMMNH